ncbi:hypothetical protein HDU76_012051, partial [Blyttiomyces sp. JEL0837]
MKLLEMYKVACVKNPLTPFQFNSLNNLQLFLQSCSQVKKGDQIVSSILRNKEEISGKFHQFNLGNNLSVLDKLGSFVGQMTPKTKDLFKSSKLHPSLLSPSLIVNAKIAILQVINGLLSLFTRLLNIANPHNARIAITGISILFSDKDSIDQRPHADGIEQLRLSSVTYLTKDGLSTKVSVDNDNLP